MESKAYHDCLVSTERRVKRAGSAERRETENERGGGGGLRVSKAVKIKQRIQPWTLGHLSLSIKASALSVLGLQRYKRGATCGAVRFGIISEEILSTDSYEVYQRPCRLVTAQHGD